MQVRVLNVENSLLGTDWIDANEAYKANNFIPVEYQDPALDMTYYENGNPNPLIRKVTFGPTTRTGALQVRLRVNGGQTYDSINVISPGYLA
jgi:predicted secreted protein